MVFCKAFQSDKNELEMPTEGIISQEGNEILENKTDVADKLNDHLVNIVETTSGKKPRKLTCIYISTGVVLL